MGFSEDIDDSLTAASTDTDSKVETAEDDEDDEDPLEARVVAANSFLKAFIELDKALYDATVVPGKRLSISLSQLPTLTVLPRPPRNLC